jgi:hypothetical protein
MRLYVDQIHLLKVHNQLIEYANKYESLCFKDASNIITLSRHAFNVGILYDCPLCVCEKITYVLLGISLSIGTSLIPNIISAFERSSSIIAPAFLTNS